MHATAESQDHKNVNFLDKRRGRGLLLRQSGNTKTKMAQQNNVGTPETRRSNLGERKVSVPTSNAFEVTPRFHRTWSGSKILLGNFPRRHTSPSRQERHHREVAEYAKLLQADSSHPHYRYNDGPCSNENSFLPMQPECEIERHRLNDLEHQPDFSSRFCEPAMGLKKMRRPGYLLPLSNRSKKNSALNTMGDSCSTGSDIKSTNNTSPKRRLVFWKSAGNCVSSSSLKQACAARAIMISNRAPCEIESTLHYLPSERLLGTTMLPKVDSAFTEKTILSDDYEPELTQEKHCVESPKKCVKRISKMIKVDGIKYMVTRETPGNSNYRRTRRFTPPISTANDGTFLQVPSTQFLRNYKQDMDLKDEGDLGKTSTLSKEDLNMWQEARDKKSDLMNLAYCSGRSVVNPKNHQALEHAALRLRKLVKSLNLETHTLPKVLQENLEYAISVLESAFVKDSRLDSKTEDDDDVPANLSPVPPEIQSWLVQTFSNRNAKRGTQGKKISEKRSLRSVAQAVRSTVVMEKMLLQRKSFDDPGNKIPSQVQMHLKDVDDWNFDVFKLEEISNGNSLKYTFYQLLEKYELMGKFKIPLPALLTYSNKLQKGYRKHNNHYHNPIHAADVAQTLNCLLTQTGVMNSLSDVEMFSMVMAAIIHDVEHTGTTNNFHINTRSHLAKLYNDKSVLENHHISTAFLMLNDGKDCDILQNFSSDDYQECRALIIEMVLATDMSQHFGQINRMKTALLQPENMEKSKAMCMLLHSADINHPTKSWHLHYKWTERLVVEFFEQGDRERELKLAISPLCDRTTTMVARSQIGFIDYVIKPTFDVIFDVFNAINEIVARNAIADVAKEAKKSNQGSTLSVADDALKRRFSDVVMSSAFRDQADILNKLTKFKEACYLNIDQNRKQWKRKEEIEQANEYRGEAAFSEEATLKFASLQLGSDEQTDVESRVN